MPSLDSHLAQARHNEAFYQSLQSSVTPFIDWIVSGIFYSSVHYVEAFFATKSIHSNNHGERDTYVGMHLQRIFKDYRGLKHKSERARYFCEIMTPSDVSACQRRMDGIKAALKSDLPQI